MIHSVVMDKRFTITVGYFLTCAICKQRVLHSDSNSANTKSWSIPEARCKKCMDLIEKAINVKQKKRNEEHYVELLCYTFIMLEFFVQRFYQISFLLNTRLTRLAVNNHTKNDWELIFFLKNCVLYTIAKSLQHNKSKLNIENYDFIDFQFIWSRMQNNMNHDIKMSFP